MEQSAVSAQRASSCGPRGSVGRPASRRRWSSSGCWRRHLPVRAHSLQVVARLTSPKERNSAHWSPNASGSRSECSPGRVACTGSSSMLQPAGRKGKFSVDLLASRHCGFRRAALGIGGRTGTPCDVADKIEDRAYRLPRDSCAGHGPAAAGTASALSVGPQHEATCRHWNVDSFVEEVDVNTTGLPRRQDRAMRLSLGRPGCHPRRRRRRCPARWKCSAMKCACSTLTQKPRARMSL